MDAKLIVIGGKASRPEIRLKLPTTIGRRKDSGLVIVHKSVSRQHCELFERDGRLFVRDNQSANGTFVNELQVVEGPLQPGDKLRVGPLTFRAEYQLRTPPPPRQPSLSKLLQQPSNDPFDVMQGDPSGEDSSSFGFLPKENSDQDVGKENANALDDEGGEDEDAFTQQAGALPAGLKALYRMEQADRAAAAASSSGSGMLPKPPSSVVSGGSGILPKLPAGSSGMLPKPPSSIVNAAAKLPTPPGVSSAPPGSGSEERPVFARLDAKPPAKPEESFDAGDFLTSYRPAGNDAPAQPMDFAALDRFTDPGLLDSGTDEFLLDMAPLAGEEPAAGQAPPAQEGEATMHDIQLGQSLFSRENPEHLPFGDPGSADPPQGK